MPIIYANSNDGVVSSLNATANTARNAKAGTAVDTTSALDVIGYQYSGGYLFERAYFKFDTTVINVAPTSADLKIYFNTPVSGDYIAVKARSDTFSGGLTTNNFGHIDSRPLTGTYLNSTVTDYSSNFTPTVAAYNTISLNAAARNDIGDSGTEFIVCLLNYTYDYLNTAVNPGITSRASIALNDFPGTNFDIYLDYVEGSAQRQAIAGATATRSELRNSKEITAQLEADTDYEVKLINNLKSQVYFTFESARGKQLFNSASIRTTTSDSGSNVIGFVSGNGDASFILKSEATSSFFISSSDHVIPGNNFKVIATNPEVINTDDVTASGSIFGIDMEFLSD